MKLKAIAAGVALMAGAGMAHAAAITPSTAGGSSLIFEAWDSVDGVSITEVLGSNTIGSVGTSGAGNVVGVPSGNDQLFNLNSVANSNAFTSFESQAGAGDSNFASDIQWHVVAANSGASLPSTLTTWGASTVPSSVKNGANTSLTIGANTQYNAINGEMGAATTLIVTSSSDPAYAGSSSWGTGDYGTAGLGGNTAISGFYSGSIDASTVYGPGTGVGLFLSLVNKPGTTQTQVGKTLLANAQGDTDWILEANGTLDYHQATPAAVPLPAAAWLFGSGLMSLAGIARRRKNKDKA